MVELTPYVIFLAVLSVIMLVLVAMAVRHAAARDGNEYNRKYIGVLIYELALIGFAVCCLTLEYALTSESARFFWNTVRFMVFVFLPPAVMYLYLLFTDHTRFNGKRTVIALHIIPSITLLLVLTNPLHHVFWTERVTVSSPYVTFIYNYSGPFFWLHAAYCYLVLMCAYGVLFAGTVKKPRIYRGQGYIMLAGAWLSLLINAVYIFDLFTDLGDLTMPALFIAAACMYWAVYVHKPTRMIEMARTLVVHELDAPVLIFDNRGVLIDANQQALKALGFGANELFRLKTDAFYAKLGRPEAAHVDDAEIYLTVSAAADTNAALSASLSDTNAAPAASLSDTNAAPTASPSDTNAAPAASPITTAAATATPAVAPTPAAVRIYHARDKVLTDKKGAYVGRYVLLNDVTHIRSVVQKLEYANTHDHFTGMLNRNVFRAELKRIDRPEHQPIALISLNIYGMKFLNTVFGYEFGDRMITQTAEIVTRLTADKGFCARISGDEFVIALRNTHERDAQAFVQQVAAEAAEATQSAEAAGAAEATGATKAVGATESAKAAEATESAKVAESVEIANGNATKATGVINGHAAMNVHAAMTGNGAKSNGIGTHISLSHGIAVKEQRQENIDLVYKNAASRMYRNKLMQAKNNAVALFEFVKRVLQNSRYETEGHVERVQELTRRMGEQMGFTPAQQENLHLLSLTHNIGIMGTPVDLIKKTGTLSNEEWEEIRLHTVRGYNIAMLFPELTPIAEDILRHHERYDGLGYPDGLKGDDIPLGAQMILLSNYYDNLTYPSQPGVKPLTAEEALEKVKKQAGAMVSPALVHSFEKVFASSVRMTGPAIVRQEDDAELAEILRLLDMDSDD